MNGLSAELNNDGDSETQQAVVNFLERDND